jgi:hypothetical protein
LGFGTAVDAIAALDGELRGLTNGIAARPAPPAAKVGNFPPRGGRKLPQLAPATGLDAHLRMKTTKYVVNSRSLPPQREIWRIARVYGHS